MSRGARCILIIASALLAVITLAATGCGNAARSPSPASSPSAASASPRVAPTPGLLMHVRLPTHMRALTRRFGSPDRIVLPVNIDTSPVGQWFKWHVRKRGVVFAALGDDYDRTPDYDAPVRYLHVQADVGATSRTLFGFVLNRTTRREVLSALGDQVVPSDGRWLYHRSRCAQVPSRRPLHGPLLQPARAAHRRLAGHLRYGRGRWLRHLTSASSWLAVSSTFKAVA